MKSKKKEVEIIECLVPEFAVCYLINGDSSGLEESDIAAIDNWYIHEFGGIVGHWHMPEDYPSFCWRHDLSSYGILACDCVMMEFVIMP